MTVMDLLVPLLLGIWRREFQCCVFGKVGISRGSWKKPERNIFYATSCVIETNLLSREQRKSALCYNSHLFSGRVAKFLSMQK